MNYYKARMYSPTLGRFMQPDPIGYGDGMNLYAYVGGDPVNFVDPSGLFGYSYNCPQADVVCDDDDGPPIVVVGARLSYCEKEANFANSICFEGYHFNTASLRINDTEQPCGDSPDNTLNIIRDGIDLLSVGADGLSIAVTATGIGAPIGGLIKGAQIGLEVGLLGVNAYDAYYNGNAAPLVGQASGFGARLLPGGQIASRTARLLRGQPRNALGQFRRSKLDSAAAQQALGTAQQRAAGIAAEGVACLIQSR